MKTDLKRLAAQCLSSAPEVCKVVVFGSFLTADAPNDMDVAVFVDRDGEYLPLALKYRRLLAPLAHEIALDVIPVRPDASGAFLDEINPGEIVYER